MIPGKITKMWVWDFWEFGRPSGASILSKRCDRLGLRCGPVISWEHSWDMSNETHRELLKKLFDEKKPKFIWIVPFGLPWMISVRQDQVSEI